jgi:uncharacterized membrane protein YhaH (DUF805 family)
MLETLWGKVLTGRLKRRQFLVAYLLVALIAAVLAFVVGAFVGAAERMAGGDPLQTEVSLAGSLGTFGVLILALLFALLLLGQLNIMAKRLRDMGAPAAWVIVLVWLLTAGLLSSAGGSVLGGLLGLGFLLALLFVPSNQFGARNAGASGGSGGN